MDMMIFENEMPDAESLRELDQSAADAIVEILEMAVHIDARVSQEELDTLNRELALLPNAKPSAHSVLTQTEADFFDREISEERYDAEHSISRIKELSKSIKSDLAQQTCLRLLAILCCCDGLETSEVEYYQHVVRALRYDYETADELLRAAHASTPVQAEPGLEEFPSAEEELI